MADIFTSYISKVFINTKTKNDDIVTVTTKFFSPTGDVFELDRRVISPSVIQTRKSLEELKPETSDVFPYKIVLPIEEDGANLLRSPNITTEVTASQYYYAPAYFERYQPDVLLFIDREFTELPDPEIVDVPDDEINPFGEVDQ